MSKKTPSIVKKAKKPVAKKKEKQYTTTCMRCHKSFKTTDELDMDGFGKCASCKKAVAEIAKSVDAKIARERAARGKLPQVSLNQRKADAKIYFDSGN